MSKKQWMLWVVCCFSVFAFTAKGGNTNAHQRQQQLGSANSYGETVISTMEGLLQGYDVSTLSSAFSQEIRNLTNYANGITSGSGRMNAGPGPDPSKVNSSRISRPPVIPPSQPKVAPATSPTGGFNITPPPKDNDVSTVPNITGF